MSSFIIYATHISTNPISDCQPLSCRRFWGHSSTGPSSPSIYSALSAWKILLLLHWKRWSKSKCNIGERPGIPTASDDFLNESEMPLTSPWVFSKEMPLWGPRLCPQLSSLSSSSEPSHFHLAPSTCFKQLLCILFYQPLLLQFLSDPAVTFPI